MCRHHVEIFMRIPYYGYAKCFCRRDIHDPPKKIRKWILYVPCPPLTNEVELISLEEIESEYEDMRTIRSVLKSVVEKPSPETQCSCKKSREKGQKLVKIGFGSFRTFLHPKCDSWIQESKLEPQRWKCKYRKQPKLRTIIVCQGTVL
ncbi:hypothetical protein [Pasteuria penetrans]|uniref:hypothetical protein n=1 Tax=Pasteuria penetrans TaxID=86005 RepID=UPI000FB0EF08|nr:hypothetical protein [Pasteuria penetrans]